MAFLLTLIALVTVYLSELVPEIGNVGMIIYILAALASLPIIGRRWPVLMSVIPILFLCLVGMVLISRPLNGWVGGFADAFKRFQLEMLLFVLVVLNASTIRKIGLLAATLIAIALILTGMGVREYDHVPESGILTEMQEPVFVFLQRTSYDEETGEATFIKRLRGIGTVGDPNDFAQFLLVTIPFLLLPLRLKSSTILRILCLAALVVLVYGVTLTRSRGSLLGVAVLLFVMFIRRVSPTMTILLSGLGLTGLLAIGATGGRSLETDFDRIDAWSTALALFKRSPAWGIGFRSFTDYHEITAHNSYMLCLAELGWLGYFCWLGMIVVAMTELHHIAKQPVTDEESERTRVWASTFEMSLYTFLITAWFLSRTYTPTLYLLLAMFVSWHAIVRSAGMPIVFPSLKNMAPRTLLIQTSSVVLMYVLVRVMH
jgi:putative inorganic carbon (HCO3(-)) transporter